MEINELQSYEGLKKIKSTLLLRLEEILKDIKNELSKSIPLSDRESIFLSSFKNKYRIGVMEIYETGEYFLISKSKTGLRRFLGENKPILIVEKYIESKLESQILYEEFLKKLDDFNPQLDDLKDLVRFLEPDNYDEINDPYVYLENIVRNGKLKRPRKKIDREIYSISGTLYEPEAFYTIEKHFNIFESNNPNVKINLKIPK